MNLDQIAYQLKTLPRFVDLHLSTNEYFDWYSVVKLQASDVNFVQLVKNCQKKDLLPELQEIYAVTKLNDAKNDVLMKKVILWDLEQQFGNVKYDNSKIIISIENEKKKFEQKYNAQPILLQQFNFTSTTIETTTFFLSTNLNSSQIFDQVKICNDIPILIYNNFVKIKPNYITEYIPKIELDSCYLYMNSFWIKFKNSKENEGICKFTLKQKYPFQKIEEKFEEHCPMLKYKCIKSTFQGNFYFPNLLLCWTSFYEICLNEFHDIVQDEKVISSKDVLKIFIDKNTKITLNITQKIVCNSSKISRLFGIDTFSIGSYYIKCTFSNVEDLTLLETVKTKLSKIMYYSQEQSSKILNEYKKILKSNQKQFLKIIPSVKPIDLKPLSSNKILRQRVPEVFVTDYPRKCLHLPRILDENENKLNAIKFPIYNEPTLPRWYSCDHHKDAIYPGLRKNPLENKEKFPYIPCCYVSEQKTKIGSDYRKYYNGENRKKYKKPSENVVYTTNRILPNGVYGEIPLQLRKTFFSLEDSYFRLGVQHANDSFIKCLEVATKKSCPKVVTTFFDPVDNFREMEEFFGVSIILFENDKENSVMCQINKTEMYLPLFSWKKDIVIILKNYGSAADLSENAQCELVCKNNFIFSKKETKKLRYLYDTFNNILRVKPKTDVISQFILNSNMVYKLKLLDGSEFLCDPLHPIYPNIDQNNESTNGKNVVDNFLKSSKQYQEELIKACLNKSENEALINYVSKLSNRSKNWIINTPKKINLETTKEYISFINLENYLEYQKSKNTIVLEDKRIDKKPLKLTYFKEEDIINLENFELFCISNINLNYYKYFSFKTNSASTKIVKIDKNWYKDERNT
jgi:hypothetical protein